MIAQNSDALAAQLLNLFSSAVVDQAICMLDKTGIVISWNIGASNFFHIKENQILNRSISLLTGGLNPTGYLEQAIAEGKCSFETELISADGSNFSAQVTITPVFDGTALQGYALLATQHTENKLKQTVHELSAYKYALDQAAIVAITDHKGIIRDVNENFCHISGYSKEELIGKDHRIVNGGYHNKEFMATLWRTITSGKTWVGEICNCRKDGSLYWVATTIVPFLNEQGKPYQYVTIRFDRTEAKLAKQQLIEKNEQIGSLLESISDGFIALDKDLRYTYVNQRICEIVGLKAGEMLGEKIWDLFPEAVGSATWLAIEEAISSGLPVTNENYYPPLSLWQENHVYPNPSGLSIFISDISWRKKLEEQQRLLTDISYIFEQTRALPELMQQVMHRLIALNSSYILAETWLIDRNGTKILVSAQMATDGLTAAFFDEHPEIQQFDLGEGLPGATWASGNIEFWSDLKNHPQFVRRATTEKAGLNSVLGIPLRYNENPIGVLMLGLKCKTQPTNLSNAFLTQLGDHLGDIITRRQLENDFQDIFEVTPDIICIIGTDRYFKKVNPAMIDLMGYSESELLSMRLDSLMHPEDLTGSLVRMQKFISGQISSTYFENRFVDATGRSINLAWTAARGKEPGILFCIGKNISEKKELENAATRFLTERNSILEGIGDAFFSLDRDWNVLYWNHVAENVLQKKKSEIVGKNLWSVFTSAVGSLSYKEYHKAFEKAEARHFEDHYLALDKWYDVSVYPSESGLSVYFKDITERKIAEREFLRQAAALEKSHRQYTDLFQLSPLPKFVFDSKSLIILDVNIAAVKNYGYSRQEFLSMTLRDIRPEEDIPLLETVVQNASASAYSYQPGIFTHRKKGGTLIQVEITSSELEYDGRKARIALAVDVTDKFRHLNAVQVQNEQLREIAWMQSHTIRAPLSRIMGLIQLMKSTDADAGETGEIMEFIRTSATELDQVIRNITANARERN